MCIQAHSGQSCVYHFFFSGWLQTDHHWIIYVWLSVIICVIFHLFWDSESMRNDLQCRREKNIFHVNSGLPIDVIWMKQKSVKYLLLLFMTMQTNHSIFSPLITLSKLKRKATATARLWIHVSRQQKTIGNIEQCKILVYECASVCVCGCCTQL